MGEKFQTLQPCTKKKLMINMIVMGVATYHMSEHVSSLHDMSK